MTYTEFLSECSKRTIHKSVAVENDKIVAALKARDDKLVLELLDTEF